MRITVLGAGAMGSLFGGYLSRENDVTVVDVSEVMVKAIRSNGIEIREKDGGSSVFHPTAVLNTSGMGHQDLIIVFVKSMFTISALESNKGLIGPDTYIMTLQNGAGHESKLLKFADRRHVIIGSTQHNSSIVHPGCIFHGGSGVSSIGLLDGGSDVLVPIAENLTRCGFECHTEENVQKQVWKKMFTNTAASSLTALFQVPLGFIHRSASANFIMTESIVCIKNQRHICHVADSFGHHHIFINTQKAKIWYSGQTTGKIRTRNHYCIKAVNLGSLC